MMSVKESLGKIVLLLLFFLWIMGAVSSLGYVIYEKSSLPIIAGTVVCVLFAIPTVDKILKKLRE